MSGEHDGWPAYHAVREVLTPDLLKPGHTGHYYHASEAAWHLLGGPWSQWQLAMVVGE